jgi:hypothetical protein
VFIDPPVRRMGRDCVVLNVSASLVPVAAIEVAVAAIAMPPTKRLRRVVLCDIAVGEFIGSSV